jgi:hypothetical protein
VVRGIYKVLFPVEHFLRQGRGVSFHEFDLAIRPARDLHVVSSLSTFQGLRYKPQRAPFERRYGRMLRKMYPDLHRGFTEDTLFLIIQKDSEQRQWGTRVP